MSQEFDLVAEYREDQGKGASRRLRLQGKVPAIIYGAGRPARMVSLDHNRIEFLTHKSSPITDEYHR